MLEVFGRLSEHGYDVTNPPPVGSVTVKFPMTVSPGPPARTFTDVSPTTLPVKRTGGTATPVGKTVLSVYNPLGLMAEQFCSSVLKSA